MTRITIGNISVVFASAHLAAHEGEEYRKRRNQDVAEIFRATHKGLKHHDHWTFESTWESNHIVWMGDLNYRTDVDLLGKNGRGMKHEEKWEFVTSLVEDKDWESLNIGDELQKEINEGRVLMEFVEGDKTHVPTFKVLRQGSLAYLKQRIPSYCDRILWRSLPENRREFQQSTLEALPDVRTSDHKPVKATFTLSFPPVMPEAPFPMKWAPKRGSHLVLEELEGFDLPAMDSMGSADPYIVISAPGLFIPGVEYNTTTQRNTQNPVWDGQLPDMTTVWKLSRSVERFHLTLTVMDHDKIGSDDLIGVAQIGLEGVEKGIRFRVPINKYGVKRGEISGAIRLLFGEGKVTAL